MNQVNFWVSYCFAFKKKKKECISLPNKYIIFQSAISRKILRVKYVHFSCYWNWDWKVDWNINVGKRYFQMNGATSGSVFPLIFHAFLSNVQYTISWSCAFWRQSIWMNGWFSVVSKPLPNVDVLLLIFPHNESKEFSTLWNALKCDYKKKTSKNDHWHLHQSSKCHHLLK